MSTVSHTVTAVSGPGPLSSLQRGAPEPPGSHAHPAPTPGHPQSTFCLWTFLENKIVHCWAFHLASYFGGLSTA